ncbi:MAG: hypothetical protein Q4A55_02750 [Aerococcus sp.]|nr:hypothetical protein [Aerococcus sp.]
MREMKKKIRGLKRKWKQMMVNLDRLAETTNDTSDEIFIAESFDYFNRKISKPYKIELFEKLLNILGAKQKSGDKRCYLLWYIPDDIFESIILIFDGFNELEVFLKERNHNVVDTDNYRLVLSEGKLTESYINDRVKNEEMVSVIATIDNEGFLDKVPLVLIASEQIISVVKKELK